MTRFAEVQSLPEQGGSGPEFVATRYAERPLPDVPSKAVGTRTRAVAASAATSPASSTRRCFSDFIFYPSFTCVTRGSIRLVSNPRITIAAHTALTRGYRRRRVSHQATSSQAGSARRRGELAIRNRLR